MPVISVQNEAVRFITGDLKDIGLKEYVIKKIQRNYHITEFWANRGISFTLEKGDMLGIVGSNGAGKSTLLKVISGVLEPTEGKIKVRGNIAALLELSSGFDGNMTVRENTYLRGALLGYTREYMDRMYDSIIAFAELEDFQDRQFKQLSSGMKSRLAFSIACLVNPDILILDEVLSVGDGAFRRKSGAKMAEILARGVTGLFVSHSVGQVRELCNKVLWLDHGRQIAFGDNVELLCNAYEEFLHSRKIPGNDEEIRQMSEAYQVRREEEQKRKAEKRTKNLKKELAEGSSEDALKAALEIIRQQKPELLRTPKADGKAATKAVGKSTGKAAAKADGKAAVKTAGKIDGKPAVKAGEKAVAKAGGKAAAKVDGKAAAKAGGKAAAKVDGKAAIKADGKAAAKADRKPAAKAGGKATAKADGEAAAKDAGK